MAGHNSSCGPCSGLLNVRPHHYLKSNDDDFVSDKTAPFCIITELAGKNQEISDNMKKKSFPL